MKDNNDTPFWGKQKPLKHYFHNGVIKFSVSDGKLFYKLSKITKIGRFSLSSDRVRDIEHLNYLLSIKVLDDLWKSVK